MRRRFPRITLLLLAIVLVLAGRWWYVRREVAPPPGVVITHAPFWKLKYLGSPSLVVMANGDYVACHDFFGPWSMEYKEGVTEVFGSTDKGKTWERRSIVKGAFYSVLFEHRGALYLLGVDHHAGADEWKWVFRLLKTLRMAQDLDSNIVIRRSDDGGRTWTEPKDEHTGRLMRGRYGFAPSPVIEHEGRLWRALNTGMLSAPVDANLLEAKSWLNSGTAPSKGKSKWFGGQFEGWGEGIAVVGPEGGIVNVVKVRYQKPGDDHAAITHISADGKKVTFDPEKDFFKMPGGRIKFSVRYDPVSKSYWALSNYLPPEDCWEGKPAAGLRRNTLALSSSPDLRNWTVKCILLHSPDVKVHGFQYPEFSFDGDDLIAVVRTGWPDGQLGPKRQHDANYMTFHRWLNFRNLTMKDSAPEAARLKSSVP